MKKMAMGLHLSRQLRGEPLNIGDHYHIESYRTIIERLKIRLKNDRSLRLRYSQLKKGIVSQEQI